ncbi:hypothetical protein [Qipengyuania sp. JC766]|uniref:hypothetical protein n=1 Tax=Qipengyuania sp. JC766 TaxID=3232139 RepID=UPI00345A0932
MAALTLGACEPSDNDPGPGGVTVGEARQLDEAAQKIEAEHRDIRELRDDAPADKEEDPN